MLRVAYIMGKMDSGGKKNLVMEYFRHIDKDKVQVDFICDADSQAIPKEEIEELGGRVYEITPYQKIFRNMKDMEKLFQENQYDIVHAWNSTMNFFPMRVAAKTKIPVRISESLSMAHPGEFKTVIKNMLKPFAKKNATHYMSCGKDCGIWQFGQKLYEEGKIAVFKTAIDTESNAYDEELRRTTRKEYGLDDKIVLGHIGRMVLQKNPVFLIDIVAAAVKKNSNVVLLLIGDGKLKDDVMERIDMHGIRDNVLYLGRREDIKQFYNAMDAFLLPSLYEGLPVVGLEAQSLGLPIFMSTEITEETKACDLAEFISLEESPEKWAECILQGIERNLERKSHGSELREAGFDSQYEAKRMLKYYENALKEVK